MKIDTQEQLIQATMKLLTTSTDVSQITARQIVAEAGTNLAMINYCFKSKDALINIAVQRIISEHANNFKSMHDGNIAPREQLRNMLYQLSEITVSYHHFTKISVPYILLNDEITQPLDVLPIIKKFF